MEDREKIVRYLAIFFIFLIVVFILFFRADKTEKNYQFSGVVKEVNYGDKGMPEVLINGKLYHPNNVFNNQLEQGDSLIKLKNSLSYKLVKFKTGKIILFK